MQVEQFSAGMVIKEPNQMDTIKIKGFFISGVDKGKGSKDKGRIFFLCTSFDLITVVPDEL